MLGQFKTQKITSFKNSKIKNIIKLRQRKVRDDQNAFGVEGAREVYRAFIMGYLPIEIYMCQNFLSKEALSFLNHPNLQKLQTKFNIFECSEDLYQKIAVREQSDGIFVVFQKQSHTLINFENKMKLDPHPLFLVLENIEKPGNLGAILRSADGAGASGVILLSDCCDPYNPAVIRSSLGTVFSTPLYQCSVSEFKKLITRFNLKIFGAHLSEKSRHYVEHTYTQPTAFILGSESHGMSTKVAELCDDLIKIPMLGLSDSLNVSVSGAVLLYEALRQRSSI